MCEEDNHEFKVITLCGSTRFRDEFERVTRELTLAGNVVVSVGVFCHTDDTPITEEQKTLLDRIHLQKIDMSDEIFVINVNNYIGSSTASEIEYTKSKGKPVNYLVSE